MSVVSFTNNTVSKAINCDRTMLYNYLNDDLHSQNNYAYMVIIRAINKVSPHKILDIDQEEYPLKIFSLHKDWYSDTTPYLLYQLFVSSDNIFQKFVNEFNAMVVKNIGKNSSGPLEYISHNYNIRVKINIVSRY